MKKKREGQLTEFAFFKKKCDLKKKKKKKEHCDSVVLPHTLHSGELHWAQGR